MTAEEMVKKVYPDAKLEDTGKGYGLPSNPHPSFCWGSWERWLDSIDPETFVKAWYRDAVCPNIPDPYEVIVGVNNEVIGAGDTIPSAWLSAKERIVKEHMKEE